MKERVKKAKQSSRFYDEDLGCFIEIKEHSKASDLITIAYKYDGRTGTWLSVSYQAIPLMIKALQQLMEYKNDQATPLIIKALQQLMEHKNDQEDNSDHRQDC